MGQEAFVKGCFEGAECWGKQGGVAIHYSLGGSGTGGSGGAVHLVLWLVGVWIECCQKIRGVGGQVQGPKIICGLVASACQNNFAVAFDEAMVFVEVGCAAVVTQQANGK